MPTSRVHLTRTHRVLIFVVVLGALIVAGIGFAGSYAAVSELAAHKGFGGYAPWFPVGVDVSIVVLLALDVLLDWLGMPLFLLRHSAWLLSAATIAFNGAVAWPDPLGVGMHATIPVSFLVIVEAARRAISRQAGLSEDRRMDGVRASRWALDPFNTARLWRRMKLWELTSYRRTIALEQDRVVYRARLRAKFGRAWRTKAPIDYRLPLRLSRYGVPIMQSAVARGLMQEGGATVPEVAPAGAPVPAAALGPAPFPEREDLEDLAGRKKEDPPGTKDNGAPEPSSGPRAETGESPKEPSPDQAHVRALAEMNNADAVRHAMKTLETCSIPVLTRWLKMHGKEVNNGQAYKIAKAAEKRTAAKGGGRAEDTAGAL
ncbi:DUF2637 domain-containing protein [Streptomyces sp. NPDC050204]|uniref:DUF2637 domain-containing protein n=1 Tax=Streptomyces sp. NPDC050204 TaxID=3155514 RepID=UPI0034208DC9